MKQVLSFLCMLMLISQTYAQKAADNYIDESIAISRLKLLSDGAAKGLLFNVENGEIKPNENANKVLNGIVNKLSNSGKQTLVATAPIDVIENPQSRPAMTPGSGKQPDANANVTAQSVETVVANNFKAVMSQDIKDRIKQEVTYLFFLMYASKNEVKQVTRFPKQFLYLNEILDAANEYFILNKNNQDRNTLQSGMLGGVNMEDLESKIIYGITDFAISRAKEEILEAHLKFLFNKMSKDDIVSKLFPSSLNKLDAFVKDNSVSLIKYGGLWKAAFQEDLRNLPVVLQDEVLVQDICDKTSLDSNIKKQLVPAVSGGDKLVYNLYLKKHVVPVLADMADGYVDGTNKDMAVFKRCVIMADVVATALGHMDKDQYKLVNPKNVELLDETGWKLFARLVYLRHKKALLNVMGGKENLLIDTEDDMAKVTAIVKQSINIYTTYSKIIDNKTTAAKVSREDRRRMYELNKQMLDNAVDYLRLFPNYDIKEAVKFYDEKCTPVLVAVSHIGEGLTNEEYGSVLDGTLEIMNSIRKFSVGCSESPDACEKLDQAILYTTRYGSFMVNVIDAENSDEVKDALDEIIPKGQYKIKNGNTFSTTISLYPGVFYGPERVMKYRAVNNTVSTGDKVESWKSSLAFYLPIGVDFNWGIKLNTKKGSTMSAGIMLQALDLGSVLNYRLGTDSSESSNPQITLNQLLSPGISAILRLPNSPVTIGCGVNYTPSLRKIEQNNLSYVANALRFGIFVGVDVTAIPLFCSKRDIDLGK